MGPSRSENQVPTTTYTRAPWTLKKAKIQCTIRIPAQAMISRTILNGVRLYSTAGEQKGLALFLSDLMKRVDAIAARSDSIREIQKQNAEKAKGAQKTQPKKKSGEFSKKQQPTLAKKPTRNVKLSVSDHPLSKNAFSMMDEGNFKSSGQNRGPQRPRENQNQGQRQRNAREARPQDKRAGRAQRDRRPRSFANNIKATKIESQAATKEVKPLPYKPVVNGDTFFYGKATSSLASPTARVSAVAKEALLKSHYPYKLPKLIIDSVAPGIHGNRFLLQKDWNLNVDAKQLGNRMKEVVKGQAQQVTPDKATPKPLLPVVKDAAQVLMANGDYSIAQKQVVLDTASGVTSPKKLLENAHWVK